MYISNRLWEKQKKLLVKAIIFPILLASNKTIISLSHGNHVLWLVYITIDSLDAKIYRSYNWPDYIFLDLILIVYE